jgi:Fe-S-cluster containining protein
MFDKYLKKLNRQTGTIWRQSLLDEMSSLEEQGIHCFECIGYCCTFAHNSMQITPLEALEIYLDLQREERLDQNFIEMLRSNVREYRLDHEIAVKKNTLLRRNYTCPFYNQNNLGCSLSRKIKPMGCLAFNASKRNVTKEGECSSNQKLLEHAINQNINERSELNQQIKTDFKFTWEKKSIPLAILSFYDFEFSLAY